MANAKTFTQAAELLSPYVPVSGRHALTATLLKNPDPLGNLEYTPDRVIETIAMKFHEVIDGGTFAYDLCTELDELMVTSEGDSEVAVATAQAARGYAKQFVRVTLGSKEMNNKFIDKSYLNSTKNYSEFIGLSIDLPLTLDVGGIKDKENGIVNAPSETANVKPTKQRPSLVAIELMNPRIGMTTRDSSAVGIFTSLIPTHELSRCVPYINMRVQSAGTSGTVSDGKLNGLSLMTYLQGRGTPAPLSGMDSLLTFDTAGQPVSSSMEIFTAPQTLAPLKNSAALRERDNTPMVLDRFRPFMSMKGLSINVTPTKGFMSYKSGKLELVLHDRSRLGEIAAFVKPGVYQGTELDIEYGWSHPDGNYVDASRNPIGSFLDGLKVREKYSVVNSTFNFDEAGQANVSLTIAMKGAMTLNYVDISECQTSNAATNLKTAIEEVQALITELREADSEKFATIFDSTIIGSAGSADSVLSLDEEKLQELRTKINVLKGSTTGADQELAAKLDAIVKPGGVAEQYRLSADEAVRTQLEALAAGSEIFPCADELIRASSTTSFSLPGVTTDGVIAKPISLGRVLMAFAGKALARTGQFDEVQFIFHVFNDKASFMRDLTIAKFPCDYTQLQDSISAALKKSLKMSVSSFMQMLLSEFVHDTGNVAYGFRQLYEKDEETGEFKRKECEVEGDDEAAIAAREKFKLEQLAVEESILGAAGITDGRFRLPKISVYPECVPHRVSKGKTILRMHVVDESSTSYGTLFEMLRSTRSADVTSFGFSNSPEHPLLKSAPELNASAIESRRKQTLADLQEKGIIAPVVTETVPLTEQETAAGVSPEGEVTVSIDIGKLLEGKSITKVKKYISEGVPTILFGRGAGAVINAGLSSLNDPALTTVNIINMNKAGAGTPDLARNRGLPMQIAPTECSLEMLGCPILSFGQFFFVDFKTGTTADNIYTVTGIDHKIEAGTFTTSAKLTLLDAYGSFSSPARQVKTTSLLIKNALGDPGTSTTLTTEETAVSSTTADSAIPTPGFMNSLGLTSEEVKRLVSSFPVGPYQGVAMIVNKADGSLYRGRTFSSNGFFEIVQTSNKNTLFEKVRSDSGLSPNRHAVIIVPLSKTVTGYVAVGVYNVSTGGPATSDEVKELVKLGTPGSNYFELSVDMTSWRDKLIALGLYNS